jgi:hypothetical protein
VFISEMREGGYLSLAGEARAPMQAPPPRHAALCLRAKAIP